MKLIIDIHEKDYNSVKNGHIPYCIFSVFGNAIPIPDNATVCDIEQIRDEIEQRMQVKPNNFNQHDESDYDRGLYTALNIIDKYTKGTDLGYNPYQE